MAPSYRVLLFREVEHIFSDVGPQMVSLSQTIVSTGHIKQMEASVMVKVNEQPPPATKGSTLTENRALEPPRAGLRLDRPPCSPGFSLPTAVRTRRLTARG